MAWRGRAWGFGALVMLMATSASADFLGGDAADNPRTKLKAIFSAYWDDELRNDPLEATFEGDHRFDDRLPDPSDAAQKTRLARNRATREALARIDPAALTAEERIDREVLLAIL